MRRNFWRGETGSSLALDSSVEPGHFYVFPLCREADEMFRAVENFVFRGIGKITSKDRSKVCGPLRLIIVRVTSCRDDVNPLEPGFVRPLFVRKNKLRETATAKAAV